MRFSWIAAVALALSGCGKSDSASGETGAKGRHRFESNGGLYSVELVTSPAALHVNQPFDVTLSVTPKSGVAADLDVLVDARMPAHFHGMTRTAKITRGAGGAWKAEGLLFHMPGHWELYIDITQGGTTERAQLDVDLK